VKAWYNKLPNCAVVVRFRKNVVFGKLVEGLQVLKRIEDVGDNEGNPSVTVKIINCGEYNQGTHCLAYFE
jgi:cyclophilin family peptidyl-prolyl cis-trans isomerase